MALGCGWTSYPLVFRRLIVSVPQDGSGRAFGWLKLQLLPHIVQQ